MQENQDDLFGFELHDTDAEAQGFDPDTGAPVDVGSNWLGRPAVDLTDLGESGSRLDRHVGPEDREDNGQAGPTQENGGLGLGDEEGLGRTGLTEAGEIGDQVAGGRNSLDGVLDQDSEGFDKTIEMPRPEQEPTLDRDQLDTMIPPVYAEPNNLDEERPGFED